MFLLRTKQNDTFVTLIENTLLVTLQAGKVNVKVYLSKTTLSLKSNQAISDGNYHLVEVFVQRNKKRVTLKINGAKEDSASHVEIGSGAGEDEEEAVLYIGGVPENLSDVLEGKPFLHGDVGDIIIDNELVSNLPHKANRAT